MKLHYGVLEVDYSQPQPSTGKRRRKRRRGSRSTISTGAVATILEDRFGVMGEFHDANAQFVADALTESVKGAFETLAMRGKTLDVEGVLRLASRTFEAGTEEIEGKFRDFLNSGVLDKLTSEASRRVHHRYAHPYRKSNPLRPAFIDTGLYQASFRAWVQTE